MSLTGEHSHHYVASANSPDPTTQMQKGECLLLFSIVLPIDARIFGVVPQSPILSKDSMGTAEQK